MSDKSINNFVNSQTKILSRRTLNHSTERKKKILSVHKRVIGTLNSKMNPSAKKAETLNTKSSDEKNSTEYETVSSTALEMPFVKKFPVFPGEEELPSFENDFCRAKAYLMKQCTETGDNLWDHLNDVLKKILTEQPRNIGDTFEEFSFRVREARFRDKTDYLRDLFVPPEHYSLSQKLMTLLKPTDDAFDSQDKAEGDDEEQRVRPDLMELLYFFEQAGVGLPRQQMFCIALHIKKLVANNPIEKYRFWGKILGLVKNYYIVETELTEEEIAKRNAEKEEEDERIKSEEIEREVSEREELKRRREIEVENAKQREIDFAGERSQAKYQEMVIEAQERGLTEMPEPVELPPWPPIPLIPLPASKAFTGQKPICPSEPTGTGVNKKTYFVCSGPGDEWIELPDVTPEQIVVARKIKRSFTGNLDSLVNTYPKFPGTEKNYLRAQIARISSGTQISPLGFYTFNEEEEPEAEEEGPGKTNYMENPDYEPVSIKDLIDPSMAFWVHHTSYILKQGRTTWWNPSEQEAEDEEEEEKMEETEEKETGPELLTPLSEDAALDSITPWSVRSTSALFPEFAIAIVRSNLWPGAYAFAADRKFENVYIGYGHKFSATNHSPEPTGEIQNEYPLGPEIMEILDPTPEEEEEWRLAHEVKVEEEEEEDVTEEEEEEPDMED